ncbi:hypothetical protein FE782_18860 [Paenibacillus antri]|uniref:VOC family protein n=1 Tax=Paenibacillus antri TaxID=2582848 RepID=A0A5R9G9J7_9BACL|nr:hypothetical protein [Paenibacillus antri]TLS50760.1 hypothetical protein FE782_18860 [Paenibacillus antri]
MTTPFRLGHIALFARNRERVASFYREWFGAGAEGGVDVVGHPNEVKTTYLAASQRDLERLRARMREAGLPVSGIEGDGAFVKFGCNDPEGNRIEVLWAKDWRAGMGETGGANKE